MGNIDYWINGHHAAKKQAEKQKATEMRAERSRQNGRKHLPATDQPRNRHIDVRLTERELDIVRSKASDFNLKLPVFVRRVLIEDVQPRHSTQEEVEIIKSLATYKINFARIGNLYQKKEYHAMDQLVKQTAEEIKQTVVAFRNWIYDQ
jgi:predicted DNA binding CopG/RHH family protein